MTDITLSHLWKAFGEKQVLRDFSATFAQGKITCLLGPSGCGKTTLLRMLLGLETPDSGQITGVPSHISALFQEHRLFEGFSPVSNVAAVLPEGRQAGKLHAAELLTQLGLQDSLYVPVHSLSGGMKRRVAIARALLSSAELLLLDEPFTGLDARSKEQAMVLVQTYRQGRTIVMVTHDPLEQEQLAHHSIHMHAISPGNA